MIAHHKKRSTPYKKITASTAAGMFFVLVLVGFVALGLLAAGSNQDIRQQAAYSENTPTPALPTAIPLTQLGPNQCYTDAQCASGYERCLNIQAGVGECRFFCTRNTQCGNGTVCDMASGLCSSVPPVVVEEEEVSVPLVIVTAIPPKPTTKPTAKPNPLVFPVVTQEKSLENDPVSTTQNIPSTTEIKTGQSTVTNNTTAVNTGGKSAAPIAQPIDLKTPNSTLIALAQPSPETQASSVKQNQQVAAQVNQVLLTSDSGKTTAPTQSIIGKTVTQVAQVVKGTVDTLSNNDGGKLTGDAQYSTLSTQEVIKPQTYFPAATVVEKVAQVAVSNAAFHDQSESLSSGKSKESAEISMLVQKGGETRQYVIPVKTDQAGRIDQTAIQASVALAMNTPDSGKLISSQVISSAQQAIKQGKVEGEIEVNDLKQPFENGFTCFTGLVKCSTDSVSSTQLKEGIDALNDSAVVITLGEGAQPLPALVAHQIEVKFAGTEIEIDQKAPAQEAKQAIAFQFSPVIDQLKSTLNADTVDQSSTQIKINSVADSSAQVQESLKQITSEAGVSDQSKIVEAATFQTILQEVGLQKAEIDYLDEPNQTKALISVPSQNTSLAMSEALKSNANELEQASKGSLTMASQVESYVKASPLYQGLTALAIPGIEKVANSRSTEETLSIKVLHVDDLNNQPNLDLKIDDSSRSGVTAIVIQDNYGNQIIKFTGLEEDSELARRSADLEARLKSDPAQFTQRVGEKLIP